MRLRILLGVCTLCLLATSGCRPRVRAPEAPPICAVVLPRALREHAPDALPASAWYGLLINRYDGSVPHDAVDCSGEPIALPPLPASCREEEARAKHVARGPVRDDELVLRSAGGSLWFAWAPLWQLDDGTAQGPLAIAELRDGRLEARAIGTLRGYRERARIEVRRVGRAYVLSVEGERCTHPEGCRRGVRLAVLERQRLYSRPLRTASERRCLSPAWLALGERIERTVSVHWKRTLVRGLALAHEPDTIVIDERILVEDRDLERPSVPPRLVRRAESRMRIGVERGELIAEGQSLWRSIVAEDAATARGEEAHDAALVTR